MNIVENPMVLDVLWSKDPQVFGECLGCHEDIYAGEELYEFEDGQGETVYVHQKLECCRDYIAEMSVCETAGE
ncbi:hypothetical protein ACN6MY_03570 [Peribacillus sp. B-H-3]|uniref:hypothetical protein n=1 Tax=Peribacillus sp. B-H-3 TaxID=3400420 RepID=UPI003B027ED5